MTTISSFMSTVRALGVSVAVVMVLSLMFFKGMLSGRAVGSIAGDFNDSLGKGLRRFLRQIVPDAALDGPVRIFAREFPGIRTGVRVWCAVASPSSVMVGTVMTGLSASRLSRSPYL